jgi:Tol biopolymer transport system component
MPARGGTARQVVAEGSNPAWSPDGQWLAYQTDEHVDITPSAFGAQAGATIALVRPDGRDGRALTRPGAPLGGHASPAWSPNGRYIGFTTFDGGRDSGAWIVSVSDGRLSRLTESTKLYELAFAADGRALYAAGGEALAYRIPFDQDRGVASGAIETLVIGGVQAVRGVSVAADGSRLAFSGMALDSQIWAQPIDPEGQPRGEAYPLTRDTSRRQWMATVSPDGRRVAYMSARRGEPPNVWVMNVDGSDRRQLTDDRFADGKPTWYPDGRRVAYFSFRDGKSGLWAVEVETRRESPVITMAERSTALPIDGRVSEVELAPSLTRAALSLVGAPHGRRRVLVSGLDRFEPRAIGGDEAWLGYPVWSPDEQSLAVELKEGSSTHLAIVDVASGAVRRVTADRGQTWVRSWSPDGRRVAAAVLRGGTWSLRWIDAASGEQGELLRAAPPNVYVRYPDWSRRGDLVVFERGELSGNIWTVRIR